MSAPGMGHAGRDTLGSLYKTAMSRTRNPLTPGPSPQRGEGSFYQAPRPSGARGWGAGPPVKRKLRKPGFCQRPGTIAANIEEAGCGLRRRIEIDGESYYLIVTHDGTAPALTITCPRENAPDNIKTRRIVENICTAANEMLEELA